ncbi:MAG TPA: ribosomal protein S18-alanine N-acetyltransferase, partial [Thermoanaerobaculia bacterium]|nr:ribosomal protein S18-alanine N-acetyltransferase [Thermoanaerobaculia bacterium]
MADDVQITAARWSDLDAIHALEVDSFPSPWRREFFESELRGDGRFCLVARRGGAVIGYLFAMWFVDEMHINKIAVAEEQRRTGIAAALMRRCLEFARSNAVATLSLEVRQSNAGAQAFYRTLEFAPKYVRPRYYPDGESAVVMVRRLAP